MKDRDLVGFLRLASRLGYGQPEISISLDQATESLHLRFRALRAPTSWTW
jgi:hypothetical protein